jgi:hypothetical protein
MRSCRCGLKHLVDRLNETERWDRCVRSVNSPSANAFE